MSRATMLIGDVFERMAEIPDGSVDLVLTSPPFLALRSYLPADHPDKHLEIGSEPTPAAFVDTLLRLSAEWRRVLAPHGTLCVELGDTYSGSGGAGGDYGDGGLRDGQAKFSGSAAKRATNGIIDNDRQARLQRGPASGRRPGEDDGGGGSHVGGRSWPLAKSLCLIPELHRIGLVYGINALTGQPSPAGTWRARNVIRWVRPNPPVGALGDKVRPATSEMVVACTSKTRWFDLTAVRGPASDNTHARIAKGAPDRHDLPSQQRDGNWSTLAATNGDPAAGAPPLDWWQISPGGYEGSHYAVFPPELCRIPVLAMCPREVCRTCGEPRRRIEASESTGQNTRTSRGMADDPRQKGAVVSTIVPECRVAATGWTECACPATLDKYRPGLVLDPFGGSGTTGLVATGNGRDALLIDLDERNADLARERIGMFLDVIPRHEHHIAVA